MTSRNTTVNRFTTLLVFSFVAFVLTASVESARAATWCVPDKTIRSVCPKTAPSLQGAIDQAASNDVIYVGPGTPAERITIKKLLNIKGLPGHLITDAGLPVGGALISILGPMARGPVLELLVLDVVTSDTGVFIEPTVTFTTFKQARVESRQSPKPAFGIQASGTSRTLFLGRGGTSAQRARVAGFQVGIDLTDVDHADVEPVLIEDNDTGIRLLRGGYQIFWNIFRNNGVALEVCGLNVCDINSNTFIENGLAVLWGLCYNPDTELSQQKMVEFNHNVFIDNVENILVETSPGEFSSDYRDDPACFAQWTNMSFEGVRQAYHKARNCLPM